MPCFYQYCFPAFLYCFPCKQSLLIISTACKWLGKTRLIADHACRQYTAAYNLTSYAGAINTWHGKIVIGYFMLGLIFYACTF